MPFWDAFINIGGVLLALVVVLALAWLVLRWMNGRMPGASGGAARLVKVLDRVTVSRTSSILLLRVQDKVMLVAMSEHAVEKLCEFDDPDGNIAVPPAQDFGNFSAALKDAAKKFGKRSGGGGEP